MRRLWLFWALMPALVQADVPGDREALTVTQSIEMVQLVDPPIALEQYLEAPLNRSLDGKHLLVVTKRGDVARGVTIYTMRLYAMSSVRRSLGAAAVARDLPYKKLAEFETSSANPAIESARWSTDGRQVAFIGRDDKQRGQVYVCDIATGKLQALTRHASNIVGFTILWDRQLLLFSATIATDWTERNRRGYVVRSQFASDLGTRDPADTTAELAHFMQDLRSGDVRELQLPRAEIPRDFTASPDGRWAVVLGQVHAVPPPWNEYEFAGRQESVEGSSHANGDSPEEENVDDDAFGGTPTWINQFYLVDLVTGYVEPIIDTPTIETAGAADAVWSTTGKSIILSNTYLPLRDTAESERLQRRATRAIVEVELASRRVTRVTDQPDHTEGGSSVLLFRGLEFLDDGTLEVRYRPYLAGNDIVRRFRKAGSAWVTASSRATGVRDFSDGIELSVRQNMNTPPDIWAADQRSGRGQFITDLNPDLRKQSIGTVRRFEWTDRLGRTFRGGLLTPPGFREDGKYPVVLQTYGFSEDEFLIDGPQSITTAYAARPLGSAGIAVLQMPEMDRGPEAAGAGGGPLGENELFVAGLEGAVGALERTRFIDPDRMGLVGWSREGMHVHYAVTFSKVRFAAAVISDSITATPMSYSLAYGAPRPGMLEWEEGGIIGEPLWGAGVRAWLDRSPLFHLDRIRTPLRMECIGLGVPSLWETFSILKRHRRPVELVHIPDDVHVLQTPWGRYTSQQGTVDWFRFWLLNQESDMPEKREQYRRWRALRHQRDAAVQVSDLHGRSVPRSTSGNESAPR